MFKSLRWDIVMDEKAVLQNLGFCQLQKCQKAKLIDFFDVGNEYERKIVLSRQVPE